MGTAKVLSLSELQALFDSMPQLGWTAAPDGSIDFYNRAWYAYTGTTFEQLQVQGFRTVHDPEFLPAVVARWQESLRTGLPFEMEFPLRAHDGRFRWFLTRVNPIRDANGRLLRWVATHTDIDVARLSWERSKQDLDQLFALSLDLLCIAGLDGLFRQVNPAFTKVLGWSCAELLSKPWLEFIHPDDREATVRAGEALNEGAPAIAITNRFACKDGTSRWLEWRAVPTLEVGLVYAAARDITEKRAAEEAQAELHQRLIMADRMASVGMLAAGVAHEINNPLSYVMANLDTAVEDIRAIAGGSPSGRMRELEAMVQEAREGAERVGKIVRGLKTFSRTDDEHRAVMDVRPTIELSINMAFNEIRHRARLVKDYGVTPLIEADDARLGQVFVNLLVNAAQAIPDGNAEANEIRIVTSTDPDGQAVVEVRDTGPGIPEDVRQRIFVPFFTTKAAGVGTGLGLSISHNIVTGLGGVLSVHSERGRGTTFRVVLPAARVQALPVQRAVPPTPGPTRRATILVVDDEPAIGVALRRVLCDHDVTVVTNVKDALDVLASDKHFDVIFSDLMMPQMTGMDFYGELSRRSPSDAAKIVFVTGGAFTPAASDFLRRVANERLEKPFTVDGVRAVVQKFMA